jgi:hypothetical protein
MVSAHMGKYAPSFLHNWFSQWHFNKCKQSAALSDIDVTWVKPVQRLWTPIRLNYQGVPSVVAVWDLKSPKDTVTRTEETLIRYFETNKTPYYLVYVLSTENPIFEICRPWAAFKVQLVEKEMIQWINTNLSHDFLRQLLREGCICRKNGTN